MLRSSGRSRLEPSSRQWHTTQMWLRPRAGSVGYPQAWQGTSGSTPSACRRAKVASRSSTVSHGSVATGFPPVMAVSLAMLGPYAGDVPAGTLTG